MMQGTPLNAKVEDFMDTQEGFTPTEVRLQPDSRYMHIEKCVYFIDISLKTYIYILYIYIKKRIKSKKYIIE